MSTSSIRTTPRRRFIPAIRSACIALSVALLLSGRSVAALAAPAPPIPRPDPGAAGDAPGVEGMQELVNVISLYVLIGAVIGGLASALVMAFGSAVSDRLPEKGKMGLLISIAAAFLCGLIWGAVTWAYNAGNEA